MDLSQDNNNFLHDCWLLDSGANIHISCSLHHFQSYQLVSDKTVTLPNNDVIPIIAIMLRVLGLLNIYFRQYIVVGIFYYYFNRES